MNYEFNLVGIQKENVEHSKQMTVSCLMFNISLSMCQNYGGLVLS